MGDYAVAEYLTEREAAKFLRLSERTLQRFRYDGTGPKYTRISKRRVVFSRANLISWASSRTFENTSQETLEAVND